MTNIIRVPKTKNILNHESGDPRDYIKYVFGLGNRY